MNPLLSAILGLIAGFLSCLFIISLMQAAASNVDEVEHVNMEDLNALDEKSDAVNLAIVEHAEREE